ncbi:putative benzoate 4-monooxygenase cytochrome p450 protein [Neofusicoccum parvum UCRNP2]|uniref:Putative benzoate 4-monooxygenase cytochrome p450 protein n=1 Tax=Botryosphaeria parva (strain UCR-NP2) TaxID=1287680 RepID=R1G2B9_BOTPV|nr:putative benzoate 4-monooxygenase cytochrome p450 protein [Neofusicoccum parvum UCRNP2]
MLALLSPGLLPGVAAAVLLYAVGLAIYRRLFHPLARIPGPLLPAITTLYQSYHNCHYYQKIAELHKIYGPVIRITPNEIHLSDPENYDKIYYMGTRFWKSPIFYGAFAIPYSTFSTPSNEVHKHRRGMINPMFSRKMVLDLEEVVQEKAHKLTKRMEAGILDKKPVDLHHGFRSVSVDVITDYAFDRSYNLLDTPDFGKKFFALKCVEQIEEVKERLADGKLNQTRPTIFSELLNPKNNDGLPIPTSWQLKDECYSMLAAAADTTGNALSTACYHTLADREIYARLRDELVAKFPDSNQTLNFVALEKLPYLTGVIKEGLRLSFGVPGRLPRVTPEGGATFNGYFVPEGTIVGMSSWLMHRNEDVFPDPMKFDPARWLDPENSRRLDRYLVAFGKGSRQCVGMPLAYCELYVTLGTFFRRFSDMELEVFETTPEDLELEDFFSSYYVAGKKWFKAVGHK